MLKISSREIIDVVRYGDDKAILVEKNPIVDEIGKYKVRYFVINFNSGEKEGITKTAYLRQKFGSNYSTIIEKIGNFVQCDSLVLSNRNVLVIYPGGMSGLFDSNGELKKDGQLDYNDSPVSGIAEDGECFWSVCPDENCVIRYFADGVKVDIRIGGRDSATFDRPHYVSSDSDNVYICCSNNHIRVVDKKTFAVSDISKRYTDLQRYYRFGQYAIVCTSDSAYLDKD